VSAGALTHLFPTAAALARADLAGIGVTSGRARTLTALAEAVVDGRVDFGGAVGEVVSSLEAVPGIGPWTAQYVALRALGDADAFPAADLVLRRAAGGRVPLSPRDLEHLADRWRPWRGYAAQHLWQSVTASDHSQS
jgi:AraC family transcriptional regulator of adaptative response / DNA-3-methyladenine glycosylase II